MWALTIEYLMEEGFLNRTVNQRKTLVLMSEIVVISLISILMSRGVGYSNVKRGRTSKNRKKKKKRKEVTTYIN